MRRNGVGRRTHQRPHAADGGAVRHPQDGKRSRRLKFFRRNAVQKADHQRKHHRRRGRIGHPHGKKRRSQENQNQGHPQAPAGHPEDFSRQPGINFLFVKSPGQGKAPEKQKNGRVRKTGQSFLPRQNPHKHGKHRHQQGGYGYVQGFRQPQDADKGKNSKPPGHLRLYGKPLEHSQEKKHVTRNDDVIAVPFGSVCSTVAHKVKINDAILFVRIRKTVSMLFHKTPEKAFPGNRETQINRRLENTHGAHHRESRATSSRSGKIQEARTCKKNRHAIARRLVKLSD